MAVPVISTQGLLGALIGKLDVKSLLGLLVGQLEDVKIIGEVDLSLQFGGTVVPILSDRKVDVPVGHLVKELLDKNDGE